MINLTIKNHRLDKYLLPELSSTPTLHIIITKPRTKTEAIHSFIAPIYAEVMRKSNNPQQQIAELPLAIVKGSTQARSLGLADKFIGLNPINISTQQKYCSQFVNYDGIKKNGFKLITNDQLKNMTYLRNNSNRASYTVIYVFKAKDMLTYEILKKLETNQHLVPPISDIYRIAQFIRLLINQNTPEFFREPSKTPEI